MPQPIWTFPRRPVGHFVGRSDELARIEAILARSGRTAISQPIGLHGLGGVGKSVLAIEYARLHAADYDAILWVDAERPETLPSNVAEFATRLGLPEASAPHQGDRVDAVRRWLASNDRWLLIFDNAERPEDLDPYVPNPTRGHVLITSRHPDWDLLGAESIRVGTLPRDKAIDLLCDHLPAPDRGEADALSRELGNLPLALAQANAFIRETGCSFADYLHRFRTLGEAFDREHASPPGYGHTVAVTMRLALDRLRDGSDEPSPAEQVLSFAAFLAPDRVPRDLMSGLLPDPTQLDAAIRTLRRFSLIETDAGSFSIHRLVQKAARDRMPLPDRVSLLDRLLDLVAQRLPPRPQDHTTWPTSRSLLEHAIQLADHALDPTAVDTDQSRDSSALRAQRSAVLLGQLGIYLAVISDLAGARALLERALLIEEAAYGPDHPEVARTLTNLGVVAQQQGDLAGARALLERALRVFEAAYGPDHPEVARTLGNLGNVARQQGDLAGARALLERALRLKEAAYGPDHPEVARTLTNLGIVAQLQGELAGARALQERALRVFEAAYGPDNPEVASTLGNLGNVAQQQGDLAWARALQERALRLKEAAYGPDHPEVARTLTNLGVVAQQQGDLAGARALQERALRLKEAAYGPDHPEVASTLGNLGVVAQLQGDLAGARALQERALRLKEAAYGPDHPEVASTLTNLGSVLLDLGEREQAAQRADRAFDIFLKFLGSEHPNTITARRLLERAKEPEPVTPPPPPSPPISKLKVLFLAAKPSGLTPLALDEEVRAIEAKIRGAEYRDRLALVPHGAVRLDDLSGLLMQLRPEVVHFSGHGAQTGEVFLLAADGSPRPVSSAALGGLFRVLKDRVRVVVFNACYTEVQARAVAEHVEAAVGMSDAIGDDHAIAFAAEFYQALAFGKSLKDAFDLGVVRLLGEGVADAEALVRLHLRPDVDPAQMILLTDRTETEPIVAPAPKPTIGIITALPLESAALRAVLGDPERDDVPGTGGGRTYWKGTLSSPRGGTHRFVIAQAGMGNNVAAIRATRMLEHNPTVGAIIMCGIAGGIPHPGRPSEHVRLGDVVVSNLKGVVQYDFVKRTAGKKKAEAIEEVRSTPHRPDARLIEAVDALGSDEHLGRRPWEPLLAEGIARLSWSRPDDATDLLAGPDGPIAHPADPARRDGQPRVYLGPIASANTLLKDPAKRDALRDQFGARAVEMEGSGIVDATWTLGTGYLVVRGICDYCDANKTNLWQPYAALAAAAYVRALLESIPGEQ